MSHGFSVAVLLQRREKGVEADPRFSRSEDFFLTLIHVLDPEAEEASYVTKEFKIINVVAWATELPVHLKKKKEKKPARHVHAALSWGAFGCISSCYLIPLVRLCGLRKYNMSFVFQSSVQPYIKVRDKIE